MSVPSDCKKGDVTVVIGVQHLKVVVKGHPLQPVIDSDLLYSVAAGDCSWGLEGSGLKRKLAIALEKAQPQLVWAGLLDDEAGRKKKALTEMAQGLDTDVPLQQWGSS